ncbi:MAG: MFS transporter, partial [Chloroflexota bacterium]|nr:MFS transporter [Chloroflexota bacterium]
MPVLLVIIGFGAFITSLDQTVVVTALPSVMLDLKVPISELDRASWVITAYLLGYTVAMPLIGRLGDVYGYPRVYQASLVVFCIGTALVAISPSLGWMVGARIVQAVGGGATIPIGMALATTLVPKGQRGLALGIVGASAEAGSMLGPAYGGAIVAVL